MDPSDEEWIERNQSFGRLIFGEVMNIAQELLEENDDEETPNPPHPRRKRGSQKRYIERNRAEGHSIIMRQYFTPGEGYTDEHFRLRFRMSRPLFLRVLEGVSINEYFQQGYQCTGKPGLSPIQKVTAALRMMANDNSGDSVDEYIRIGGSTAIEAMKQFCQTVRRVFGEEYLRSPNANDVQKLLKKHEEKHGFPGMLGSVDCMHWEWKNCPTAWAGQYTRGDKSHPTIMLEAVASYDLHIWHAFFGVPGSNNDINVINQSPLFNEVTRGTAPEVNFTVNGRTYTKGYYLADGIYPEWATLVKTFPHPIDPKRVWFANRQESARKDIERAFGVLQSRWGIIKGGARLWSPRDLTDIMYACVILHNMIVEDEGAGISNWDMMGPSERPQFQQGTGPEYANYLRRHHEVHDREGHHALRHDLLEHLWAQRDA